VVVFKKMIVVFGLTDGKNEMAPWLLKPIDDNVLCRGWAV